MLIECVINELIVDDVDISSKTDDSLTFIASPSLPGCCCRLIYLSRIHIYDFQYRVRH